MQPSPLGDSLTADKRHESRQLVFKRAVIIKGTSNCEVSCVVRNQNASGACLSVSADARVPAEFLLYVPVDGVAYRAELRWRRKDEAGLRFSGSEPKPRLHYG